MSSTRVKCDVKCQLFVDDADTCIIRTTKMDKTHQRLIAIESPYSPNDLKIELINKKHR